MTDDRYENYTNRETWAVDILLSNTPSVYHRVTFIANAAIERAEKDLYDFLDEDIVNEAVADLANVIEDIIECEVEMFLDTATRLNPRHPTSTHEIGEDIIRSVGSLWRVNWRELAEELLNTACENKGLRLRSGF